ncbi:MAG: hypothetical protein JO290_09180 [Sphingomonadaceae bacterium]|nr:hypothetical protein [Sphingomonadaceae bacterium]
MTRETHRQRARRKFVFGVLEQLSNILGTMSASVLVVGLIVPTLAAFAGTSMVASVALRQVAGLVVGFSLLCGVTAATVRGLARAIDDDDGALFRGRRSDPLLSGGNG